MKLSIALDAIYSRNRYTTDPAPVIAELRATAGDRHDALAEARRHLGRLLRGRARRRPLRGAAHAPGPRTVDRARQAPSVPAEPEHAHILRHGQAAALPPYITTDPAILDAP